MEGETLFYHIVNPAWYIVKHDYGPGMFSTIDELENPHLFWEGRSILLCISSK